MLFIIATIMVVLWLRGAGYFPYHGRFGPHSSGHSRHCRPDKDHPRQQNTV